MLPFSGVLGFWVCWYALFLVCYAASAALQWNRLAVRDRVAAVALTTGGLLACAIVVDQVGYTLVRGFDRGEAHVLLHPVDGRHRGRCRPLTSGGIVHALSARSSSSPWRPLLSVPLGIAAALFLAEVGGRAGRPVRTLVDAMTALPDIIAGLFILAFLVLTLGLPKSGFAAALALAVTMLPIVTRASEAVLRIVPGTLREASYALGGSQWRTVLIVVLPTARSGLTTAVVLAMARGIGETAPLLLVAGYAEGINTNPFNGWQTSLPLFIYNEILSPESSRPHQRLRRRLRADHPGSHPVHHRPAARRRRARRADEAAAPQDRAADSGASGRTRA